MRVYYRLLFLHRGSRFGGMIWSYWTTHINHHSTNRVAPAPRSSKLNSTAHSVHKHELFEPEEWINYKTVTDGICKSKSPVTALSSGKVWLVSQVTKLCSFKIIISCLICGHRCAMNSYSFVMQPIKRSSALYYVMTAKHWSNLISITIICTRQRMFPQWN